MSYAAQILQHISENPGATNRDIAGKLDIKLSTITSCTTTAWQRGQLIRTLSDTAGSGMTTYGYTVSDNPPSYGVNPPVARKPKVVTKAVTPPRHDVVSMAELVEQLAESLAIRIVSTVRDRLAAELNNLVHEQHSSTRGATETAGKPDTRKKVLIVGLLPQQSTIIQREFGDVYKLSFWKDESLHKLKSMADHADYVITSVSFVSHKVTDILKTCQVEMINCSGGLSTVKDKLTELYVN